MKLDELEALAREAPCPRKKCGEYNMFKCVKAAGHTGECCFVVDHENDYAHNKPKKSTRRTALSDIGAQ